ncbi:MAG: methyl-accepting chemotaxis protein [Bacillota bacterium]|nr:methyl-accepting chemotaxis protein [Bacillota bacterium]
MLFKMKEKAYFKSLKWRFSLVLILILTIILVSLGVTIFYYASGIVKDQVNEKILLLSNNYKDSVSNLLGRIDEQLNIIATDNSVYNYLELLLIMYPGEEATEAEMDNFFSFMDSMTYTQYTAANQVDRLISQLKHTKIAYAALADGLTVLDSRVKSFEDSGKADQYVRKRLAREYYRDIEFGQIIKIEGEALLLYSKPVLDRHSNDIIAYLVVGFSPDLINTAFASLAGDDEARYTIVNDQGFILRDDNPALFARRVEGSWYLDQLASDVNFNALEQAGQYLMYNKISDNLSLLVDIPMEKVLEPVNNLRNAVIYLSLFFLIGGFIIILVFVSRQLNSFSSFLASFNAMKSGDLTDAVKLNQAYLKRKDEFGILARSFNEMVDELRGLVSDILFQSRELADASNTMNNISRGLGLLAEQVGDSVQIVSAGSQEQLVRIEETGRNVVNFNKQIRLIDNNSRLISSGSDEVLKSIEKGDRSVNYTIDRINSLSEDTIKVAGLINELGQMSQKIEDIVDLISNIANQTNLLALNAAIEAARAGQAGQGFSVVADEIRDLAEQSSSATENITALIRNVQERVSEAVELINNNKTLVSKSVEAIKDTDRVFNEIEEVSLQFREIITSVVEGLEEMTKESQQVEEAIQEISVISRNFAANSEEIAASTEEQLASTEEIVSAAETLKKMSDRLMNNVNKFKI